MFERLTYWNEEYGCWSYKCASGDAAKRLAAYEDTGLAPEQIEDMKENMKQYDDDRIAAQQECGFVCKDALEMHQQIQAQQQEINLLIMEITELRESNQALKDYAENADADKDEQAGRMDYLLRRTLPILEATNNQQELIEAIYALLGGAEG